MSAPAEILPENLSGKWALNKILSDSTEPSLSVQGVNWVTRKTLSKASLALSVSQYVDEAGIHHFDTESRILGKTIDEKITLDGKMVEVGHPLLGQIKTSQTWAPVHDIEEDYLKEALENGTTHVVEFVVVNDDAGWTSRQVCAIEDVNGERRHTRRSIITNRDGVVKTRLVYDWQGNI